MKLDEYLSPAFEKIITDDKKYVIVQGVRQSGKTRYICFKALIESLIESYKTIFIGVVNEQMVRYYKNALLELFSKLSPELKTIIRSITNNEITFNNGSKIYIQRVTDNINQTQGMKIDVLLLDEFAFVDNRTADEFMFNFRPAMAQCNSSIHIVSTRYSRSKKNYFWFLWLGSIKGTNKFTNYKIPTKKAPWINTKQLKFHMTRSQYDREFTIRTK